MTDVLRVPVLVAVLLSYATLLTAGHGTPLLAAALVVGVVVVAVLATAAATESAESAVAAETVTLRGHAHRTAFLRTRDPDARGRRRPRAPGHRPAAGPS